MKQAITKEEIRRIYALGAGAGLVESGNPDDMLHVTLRAVCGKDKVSDLTHDEAQQLQRHLISKLQDGKKASAPRKPAPRGKHEERPGGVTADQQKKVWAIMYQLRDMDGDAYSTATLGERLCGIIRKTLHRDCTPERPFAFLTLADGWRLIETLKGMVQNVKPKGGRRDAK